MEQARRNSALPIFAAVLPAGKEKAPKVAATFAARPISHSISSVFSRLRNRVVR